MTETPRTTPELDEAISGLCAIHARLLREIQEAQAQKFPGAVWTEKQAWEDAASLIIALVELERAKAALVLDREVSALRDALERADRAELSEDDGTVRNAVLEEVARMVDRRRDERFAEHGTREWDTNACYYSGQAGEMYESLDEEDEEIASAIRAMESKP